MPKWKDKTESMGVYRQGHALRLSKLINETLGNPKYLKFIEDGKKTAVARKK